MSNPASVRQVPLPENLGLQVVAALAETLEALLADPSLRVLVLTGSADAFCRGLDAGELLATGAEADRGRAIADFQRCLQAIRLGPKPCVALVDGPAQGGGVGLAAACDVVVASERATFAFPETLFGLIPAMILPLVLERMAPQKVRLWAITAASRTAQEALEAGLVDQLVSSDQLDRAGQRWAHRLGRARPSGLGKLARFSARAAHLSPEDALTEGGRITLEATGDPEVRKALRSFQDHGSWEDL